MKIEARLENINGDVADIWIGDILIFGFFHFINGIPEEIGSENTNLVKTNTDSSTISNLMCSGASIDDIIKLRKEGLL